MKTLYFFLIILSLIGTTFSKSRNPVRAQARSRVICNQKNFPMKVEQSLNANLLTVTFTANQKIESFSLNNVRGIDGAKVLKFQDFVNQKLERGEARESNIELDDFTGQVYIVFDISLKINGTISEHSIPVMVGVLSDEQKAIRSKNIKEIKINPQQKDGTNPMTVPFKKIHEMKIE